MQPSQIELVKFSAEHLEGALTLSRQAGWPHRLDDWAMVLSLSIGIVALEDGRVVGTTIVTTYGATIATINMVIVDEAMRGRGIGRKLMDFALKECEGRECRLIATQDGLPLYTKLGFEETGTILQLQGNVSPTVAADVLEWATSEDLAECSSMDRAASGLEREPMLGYLQEHGRIAVLRNAEKIVAFAGVRLFGRGEVIGPVVAVDIEDARTLIGNLLQSRRGTFVRIDTTAACGLAPWLEMQGLSPVGGGIAMRRHGSPIIATPAFQTFALASQALG
jgi:GNAT superfamily N-acetyltransferase